MKKIKKILFFIALVLSFSCEDQPLFVKCPDCTSEEPVKSNLEIKLDINYFGAQTLINVYEGNLSDSILYGSYNASGTKTTIPVVLNKKYTVTASYYVPNNFYIAVDSATPRVMYDKNQCDSPCYFVYDKVVDLRLKHIW